MKKVVLFLLIVGLVGCGDGRVVISGTDGVDGLNSLVHTFRSSVDASICESESGVVVNSGLDDNRDLVLDGAEIDHMTVVCDGLDGQDGADGQDGQDGLTSDFFIVEAHDPCGDGSGHDEIILELADGTFLAWYLDLGLSILSENVGYQTTDSQKCKFEIVNGQLVD